MFDVIDFLESAGQDAQWRQADMEARAAALTGEEIPPTWRAAMLAGDAQGLQGLLGQPVFCCLISPAKPGEKQEECDGNCKEGDDQDADKDESEDVDKGDD